MIEGALFIAIAQVLSMLKLWEMPWGGSVTLAMVPILLFAVRWGVGPGLAAGFVFGILQFTFDGGFAIGWQSIIGDYLLAFTALGLAGLFRKKGTPGIIGGVILALCVRYLCHIISGGTVFAVWMPEEWSNPWIYSAAYNGAFMLPELVLTTVAAFALTKVPAIKKLMKD